MLLMLKEFAIFQPSSSDGGLGVGAIVGIAVGSAALLALVAALILWVYKRPNKKKFSIELIPSEAPNPEQEMSVVN